MMREATLRCAGVAEVGEIEAFIDAVKVRDPKGGKHLLGRPPAEFRHAAENRLLYLCLAEGRIAALSGVFIVPFAEESQAQPEYMEFGSTAVHPDWRSYGLQKLLGRVRISSAAISQPELVLGTAIDPTNLRSRRNMIGIGFEAWPIEEVPPCAFDPCMGCEKRVGLAENLRCCSEFLRLPDAQKRVQIAILLDEVVPGLSGCIDEKFAPAHVTLPHRSDSESSLKVMLDCHHLRSIDLLRDLAELSGKAFPF